MLVSLTELMKDATEKNYAVGAFNATNLESLTASIRAAEEMGKPIILNHADVHSKFITLEEIAPIMRMRAERAKVPVCLNLDHGESLERCMQAIKLGFTSVMLDASSQSYEDNLRETALVCRMAHSVGVTVEAELGHIFASDNGIVKGAQQETIDNYSSEEDVYTDPLVAKDFVEKTGVDVLAIAFGTAHGIYKKKPRLDLDRISLIRNSIDIPFVMHGGSGLTDEEYATAINNGIRKINYYTYMTLAGGRAVKEAMDKVSPEDNIFFHDIPLVAIDAMKNDIVRAINLFSREA
jgi:fructose-bisphosphate aldolase class II